LVVLFPIFALSFLVPFHNKREFTRSFIAKNAQHSHMSLSESCRHIFCSLQSEKLLSRRRRNQNMPDNGSINPTPAGGVSGTPTTGTVGGTNAATGTATALSQTAQEYGQKISEVASQAKDYVNDKVSIVGDKLKDLQNADLGELAENAKDYARKKPGQAILISAAAGLILGLILRGRR
jgi:ElaB/YqjD/DUF883 family membrane-anchored ribosome-binding protein